MFNDPAALSSVGAWSMNVFSSVGLIMVNKAVMSWYGFVFATTLTAFHFVTTAAVGNAGSLLRAVLRFAGSTPSPSPPSRHVPVRTLLWFSLVASLAVVTMNLSLMLNSVGFYQIAKLSIIPSCCFFEAVLHGKTFSTPVRAAVIIVMVGVAICTVTDVSVKLPGLLAAVAAVLSTTFQQIYIGQLQKKYSVGSFDLLSKTAPYQALLLCLLGPPMDFIISRQNVLSFAPSSLAVISISLSCLLALFVNLSMYLCIGKFSAVSFQVLGHMKTLLVLALGWTLFGAQVTFKNVVGMSVAVVGMIAYSWAVEREKASLQSLPVKASDSAAASQQLLGHQHRK